MEVRLHTTDDDLRQILHLQKQNHKDLISPEQAESDGYVTVRHSMQSLSEICGSDGHIIALEKGRVIGYALTMHSRYADRIPVLSELMLQLRKIVGQSEFLIIGQLCVANDWRGKGVVNALYHHMKLSFKDRYKGIYTEIASDNKRSLRAHEKCGFDVLHIYPNKAGKEWQIVFQDWYK